MFLNSLILLFNLTKDQVTDNSTDKVLDDEKMSLPSSLETTVGLFKSIYSYPDNSDVQFRSIQIGEKKAYLLYIKTITDINLIEGQILSPL